MADTQKPRPAGRLAAQWAYRQVEPVMRPLLGLFAVVDTVITVNDELFKSDEDLEDLSKGELKAIIREQQKSIGEIYREWKICRLALDPEFDMKAFRRSHRRRASGRQNSSTESTSTSEKSRRRTGHSEKRSAGRSVPAARSSDRASSGRSRTKRRSGYGED